MTSLQNLESLFSVLNVSLPSSQDLKLTVASLDNLIDN